MAKEKKPSIYVDRGTIGSSNELDEYGVWVKSDSRGLYSEDDEISELPGDDENSFELPDIELPAAEFSGDTDTADIDDDFDLPLIEDDEENASDTFNFGDLSELTDTDDNFTETAEDVELPADDEPALPDLDDFSELAEAPEEIPDDEIVLEDEEFAAQIPSDDEPALPDLDDFSELEEIPDDEIVLEDDEFTAQIPSDDDFSKIARSDLTGIPEPEEEPAEAIDETKDDIDIKIETPFSSVEFEDSKKQDEPPAAPQEKTPDLSTQLLMKIAEELSSIRSELGSLKKEFSGIKASAAQKREGEDYYGAGDDEKIALTGDELNNILNTADFTEETGSDAIMELSDEFDISEPEEISFESGTSPEEAPEADSALEDISLDDLASLEDTASLEDISPEDGAAEPLEEELSIEDLDSMDFDSLEPLEEEVSLEELDALDLDSVESPEKETPSEELEVLDFDSLESPEKELSIEDLDSIDFDSVEPLEKETPSEELEILDFDSLESPEKELSIEDLDSIDFDSLESPEKETAPEELDSIDFDSIELSSDDLDFIDSDENRTVSPDSFETLDMELEEDSGKEAESGTAPDDADGFEALEADTFAETEDLFESGEIPEEIIIDLADKETEELSRIRDEGAGPMTFAPAPEDTDYLESDPLSDNPAEDISGLEDDDIPLELSDDALDLSGAVIDEPDLSLEIQDNPIEEPSFEDISINLDLSELESLDLDSEEFDDENVLIPESESTPEESAELTSVNLDSDEAAPDELGELDPVELSPEELESVEPVFEELAELDVSEPELIDIGLDEDDSIEDARLDDELSFTFEDLAEDAEPLSSAEDLVPLELSSDEESLENLAVGDLEPLSDEPETEASGNEAITIEDLDTLDVETDLSDDDEAAAALEEIGEEEVPEISSGEKPLPQSAAAPGRNFEIPSNLKNELKTVLSYMDRLLEALPDEKIEEFARSEYYETYKKLFNDLGLV